MEFGGDIAAVAKDALSGWLEVHLGRNLIPPKPSQVRRNGRNVIGVPVDPLLAIRLQLRWARAEESLTQEKLAERLGMTQQQLARLESGESNPTVRTIARVAHGLGRRVVMTLEKSFEGNFARPTRSGVPRRARSPETGR
ncbi:MAG: helix-turn-helix domain-containing protein [Gemmatimonadota bacterium]|nr:helix-turn-helix domain-containing protein [Gemmatimonadota bacterium]